MKPAFVAYLLFLEKFTNHLDPFLKSGATFVERHAEPAEFMRQKSTGETHFQATLADAVEHSDLPGKLQGMIESRQNGTSNQLYPAAALRCRREECDRVWRVATVPLKIMLNDTNMMKSERICLGNKAKTLVEIDVRSFLLRSDIREKINAYFHSELSITEPIGHKEAQETQNEGLL